MDIRITGLTTCKVVSSLRPNTKFVIRYVSSVARATKHSDPTGSMNFSGYCAYLEDKVFGWVPKADNPAVRNWMRGASAAELVAIETISAPNGYPLVIAQLFDPMKAAAELRAQYAVSPVKIPEEQPKPKKESPKMKTPSLQEIVASNIAAAGNAAKLELGHVANDQLAKIISKRLSKKQAALLNTPFGHLLLANVASVASQAFYPSNTNLRTMSNAMTVDAYQQIVKEFDIPGIISELLSNKQVVESLAQSEKE